MGKAKRKRQHDKRLRRDRDRVAGLAYRLDCKVVVFPTGSSAVGSVDGKTVYVSKTASAGNASVLRDRWLRRAAKRINGGRF